MGKNSLIFLMITENYLKFRESGMVKKKDFNPGTQEDLIATPELARLFRVNRYA
jgi:hypothetical protein